MKAFKHPWLFQVSYIFPSLVLVPVVLAKFLAEHVTDEFKLLILNIPW